MPEVCSSEHTGTLQLRPARHNTRSSLFDNTPTQRPSRCIRNRGHSAMYGEHICFTKERRSCSRELFPLSNACVWNAANKAHDILKMGKTQLLFGLMLPVGQQFLHIMRSHVVHPQKVCRENSNFQTEGWTSREPT